MAMAPSMMHWKMQRSDREVAQYGFPTLEAQSALL
ncbi:hypothetical protein BJB45_02130 [Halomonas huangheensis]|uniref:Uncharacterized protein n=1 Tax=Halomonas huangheensis TaxID=1178482 RepID=W1N4U2_9GAMM|nr:hypothetical protein BJB45_02130 [Halomonas huangheensis]